MVQILVPGGSGDLFGDQGGAKMASRASKAPKKRPKWRPKGSEKGSKIDQIFVKKFNRIWWWILEQFWFQNGSKIDQNFVNISLKFEAQF